MIGIVVIFLLGNILWPTKRPSLVDALEAMHPLPPLESKSITIVGSSGKQVIREIVNNQIHIKYWKNAKYEFIQYYIPGTHAPGLLRFKKGVPVGISAPLGVKIARRERASRKKAYATKIRCIVLETLKIDAAC